MRKEYGKHWHNEDIDNKYAAKYYVQYFDQSGDNKVSLDEFKQIMARDQKMMATIKKKPKGRRRDPGLAWILDFNNDGIVTAEELDEAPELLEEGPKKLPQETLYAQKTEL